jgi:hypothetical protein
VQSATADNPFFVTEVLASAGDVIPPTVAHAVLARIAQLDEASRTRVEQLAVVAAPAARSLVEALPGGLAGLIEAERSSRHGSPGGTGAGGPPRRWCWSAPPGRAPLTSVESCCASCGGWVSRVADFPGAPVEWAGLRGDWRGAAAEWEVRGQPYERALELIHSGEPTPTVDWLLTVEALGAGPAAAQARARLRGWASRASPAALGRRPGTTRPG